jgi:vanillate/3-O-methylgallate O-demethylase
MASFSLEEKIKQCGNPVEMLRHSQVGPYVFPVQSEYSNWRDEQESWMKGAVLFNQSFHMTDTYFEGPDVYRLLSDVSINGYKNFPVNKAKQIVCCNHDGYVIGDSVLFHHAPNLVSIVGRPATPNWVEFMAATGGYDVKVRRDERSVSNPNQRTRFRLQVQGPTAGQIFERANGGPMPEIPFFSMGDFKIGQHKVTGLNHRMSGAPGLEFWGPMEELDSVIATLKEVGADLGLKLGGSRTYSTVAHESGWIPSPTPAYREWLSGNGFEANASLGGSFYSDKIEDYYQTPWDLGYGKLISFDKTDFIGKQALLAMKDQPHRTKKWLHWNDEDVMEVFQSMFNDGDRFKHMEMPAAHYATLPFDKVLLDGKLLGVSLYPVYTANVRGWISLSMLDEATAKDGTEVQIVWGEENGGSRKPGVERHVQTTIRARVASGPFA